MKKLMFIMAVLVAAILTSCSNSDDENKEEIVDTTPVNITVGKTWNINGAKNLVTSNDFIVTANGGSITSKHVGETTVKEGSNIINVSVNDYSYFKDPITKWGCSTSYVNENQKLGILQKDVDYSNSSEYNHIIAYKNADKCKLLAYFFKDDKLVSTQTYYNYTYESDYLEYINNRYKYEFSNGESIFIGYNASERTKAGTYVTVTINSNTDIITTYFDSTKYNW